jgi:DNA segregation ATPase FtsK/SpoIIIE, S-DNA-T family
MRITLTTLSTGRRPAAPGGTGGFVACRAMLIVVQGDGQEREVAVDLHADDACVRDLMAAVGLAGDGVTVDGRSVPADTPIAAAGLVNGALVTPGRPDRPAVPLGAGPDGWLMVVAGTGAGRRFPLLAGHTHRLGRRPDLDVHLDDPTVSALHATVTLDAAGTATITDGRSRNGTWVGGAAVTAATVVPVGTVVRCGAVALRLDGPDPDDRPRPALPTAGRVPFNRPPRAAPPPPVDVVALPPPSPDPAAAARLNLVAVLAPLAAAAAMVVLSGNPRFALFVLLSPVMAVGTWLSSRRAARRSRRAGAAATTAALARFHTDLAAQREAETRRREEALPHLGEILRRATAPSVRLWERRRDHDDALRLRLGSAEVPWDPPVVEDRDGATPETRATLQHARLPAAPVEVDLSGDAVVGIVGARGPTLALARSLVVQAAVLHGPADVEVAICTDRPDDWDWAVWLPHARTAAGGWSLAGTHAEAVALLQGLVDAHERAAAPAAEPVRLVILDDERLLTGRGAPARRVLQGEAGSVAGIVIATTEDALPAACATVVTVGDGPATATVWRPWERRRLPDVLVAGLAAADARRAARALARFEDPDAGGGGALPAMVRLVSLLGDPVSPAAIAAAWRQARADPAPTTPIGLAADGPVVLDLRHDGPHALIGGTTGAGKSECLRSLVAGLAARLDPEHLVFVLVDYKGGSAFDEAARLPHVVGLVTDLDDHLGERALTSLEAELRHRERVLRAAGAADLDAYLAAGAPHGPLPRLVVVIDEFATLAAELPDFLPALVGIAQRGRSLGLHLVLATQRPQGAVDATITANTNLRIALRFQAASDSTHLIDRPDAAHLDRATPGRALVRRGAGDLALVQTALVTGRTPTVATPVTVTPLRFGPGGHAPVGGVDADVPTDLDRLVAACRAAFETSGQAPPRRPWLPMLPADLPLAAVLDRVPPDAATVPFGLVDRPDEQAQVPATWDPAGGHLAVFGTVGSGVTSTLVAIAQSLAARRPPDACHLYALDHGDGGLAGLGALPHTGAVVGATERERRLRLLAHLEREIHRRRHVPPSARNDEPLVVLLVDGVGGLLADQGGVEGLEFAEALARVLADGPAVGVAAVLGADRPAALPLRLAGNVALRLCLRLADPTELGLRRPPRLVPGRGVLADGHRVVQVGRPDDADEVAAKTAARWSVPPARPPTPIGTLPARVVVTDLPAPTADGDTVRLPVGVGDLLSGADDRASGGAGGGGAVGVLGPAVLELHPGEPVLVAGPPRSGRTTALQLLSAQLRVALPDAIQIGICNPRSALHGYPSLDGSGAPDAFAALLDRPGQRTVVVLVDDAPQIADDRLAALVDRPDVLLVASARPADLRGNYGHWTRALRAGRTGLLLAPDVTADGDLLGVRLPRRPAVPLGQPGRGALVQDGAAVIAQFALPPAAPPRGSLT